MKYHVRTDWDDLETNAFVWRGPETRQMLTKKANGNAIRLRAKKKKGRTLHLLWETERRDLCFPAGLCHSHQALGLPWFLRVNVVGRRLCLWFCRSCVPHLWLTYSDKTLLTLQEEDSQLPESSKPRPPHPRPSILPPSLVFLSIFSLTPSAFLFYCSLNVSNVLIPFP